MEVLLINWDRIQVARVGGKLHIVPGILYFTTLGVVVDMHFSSSDIVEQRSCILS